MRFRHKLSIVLVLLAIVPLVAAGVLVGVLLQRNQVSRVDSRLSVAAAAAQQRYVAQLEDASAFARRVAERPDVTLAFAAGKKKPAAPITQVPRGMRLVLVRNGAPIV